MMDSITSAELLELILLTGESVEAQFLHWLMITFALVAIRYIARDRLTRLLCISVSVLYFALTVIFVTRWASEGTNYAGLLLEASDRGITWSNSIIFNIQANLTFAIFILGTALTIWFINHKNIKPEVNET